MKIRTALYFALSVALIPQSIDAQQSSWTVTAGVGMGSANVYPGAEELFVTALPIVNVAHTRGRTTYSASILDGLGITHALPHWGVVANVNLKAGPLRDPAGYNIAGVRVEHRPETRALLVGTTPVETPVILTANLHKTTPIGRVGVSVGVHRTTIEGAEESSVHTGLTYALQYLPNLQATERLSVGGLLSVEYMDATFADSWHSRSPAAPGGDTFHASAGWRGGLIAAEVRYRISDRVSLQVLGGATALMSHARRSPFTADRLQRVMRTQLLYHF